jgi:cysteine synthase
VIFIPETQSQEKMDTLSALGCDVRPVPAVPYSNPAMYQHQAGRYAEELVSRGVRAVWGNQFDNTANQEAHLRTTGPEIWHATKGKLDAFVAATGTGGTLAGTGAYLKQQRPDIRVILADPPGSCLYSYVKTGELKRTGDGSITEGIANGRVTENLRLAQIDDAVYVPDEDTLHMLFHLLHIEGIAVGASSALNVAAAVQVGCCARRDGEREMGRWPDGERERDLERG